MTASVFGTARCPRCDEASRFRGSLSLGVFKLPAAGRSCVAFIGRSAVTLEAQQRRSSKIRRDRAGHLPTSDFILKKA
jgi:hypothetical protein